MVANAALGSKAFEFLAVQLKALQVEKKSFDAGPITLSITQIERFTQYRSYRQWTSSQLDRVNSIKKERGSSLGAANGRTQTLGHTHSPNCADEPDARGQCEAIKPDQKPI